MSRRLKSKARPGGRLRLTSPADAANKYAAELRRNGVQVVVLLAHIGGQMENGMLTGAIVPVLDNLKGIDAVASGDSIPCLHALIRAFRQCRLVNTECK